jgi:oligoendopeptidase F
MALPRRAEVAQAATWDLESIFASQADWEAAFAEAVVRRLRLE